MSQPARGGLVQTRCDLAGAEAIAKIKRHMWEKHDRFVALAAKKGVNVLCFQEIFYDPYFCDPRGQFVGEAFDASGKSLGKAPAPRDKEALFFLPTSTSRRSSRCGRPGSSIATGGRRHTARSPRRGRKGRTRLGRGARQPKKTNATTAKAGARAANE